MNKNKYNRICATISDANNDKLNSLASNKKFLTKSAIVDIALNNFFEGLSPETLGNDILNQVGA